MKQKVILDKWGAFFISFILMTIVVFFSTFCLAAPPINDNFNSATEVLDIPIIIDATTWAATREAGEPDYGGVGESVWWKWTSSSADTVAIHLHYIDSGFITQRLFSVVYTGNSVDNLIPVTGSGTEIILTPTVGTTYYIAVDSNLSEDYGFTFNITPYTPAQNDNFVDATILVENSDIVVAHNILTGRETGEPDHSNLGFSFNSSVWWKWTATFSDPVAVNVTDANFNECVVVYTGSSVDQLTAVAGVGTSLPYFTPVPGTTYYIAVANDAEWDIKTGAFKISLSQHPSPQNDDLANGVSISLGKTIGHNVGSTLETGEISDYGIAGSFGGCTTVWYKWIAVSSEIVSIDVSESNYKTLLAVFSGDSIDTLTQIVSDFNYVNFIPVQGGTYNIVINGEDCAQGDFTINLSSQAIAQPFAWSLFLPTILGNRLEL